MDKYKPLSKGLRIEKSKIQGFGLFTLLFLKAGTNLGTSHIKMFIVMYMPGDGAGAGDTHNGNLYFRPKGSTRAVSTPMIAFGIQHEGLASGHTIRADGYLLLECDIARKIEYYMIRDQGTSAISFYMHTHGYRLG